MEVRVKTPKDIYIAEGSLRFNQLQFGSIRLNQLRQETDDDWEG